MKYIGNISSIIDCEGLIKTLSNHNVEPSHGHMELDNDNPFYEEYLKQTTMLDKAGYDASTVEYRHYKSGEHFDKDIENKLSEYLNCKPLMCWVSEIRPGKCTPWHWDINPWENEHKQLGTLVRYLMFVSKPGPGHVFVTEDMCFYNEEQGNLYQYPDLRTWHAGGNIGITPKFVLTLTGYQ